jgi:hypothetical protein
VPGIILAVRWAVVAPVVVAEGLRGPSALRRSAALVKGSGWWVLGAVVTITIASGIAGALIAVPFEAFANALDAQAMLLVGEILGQAISLPFSALATILVYFTLRARSPTGAPPAAGWREGEPGGSNPFGTPDPPDPRDPPLPGGWQPPVPPR